MSGLNCNSNTNPFHIMKKILSTILGIFAFVFLFLVGVENSDGSCNLLWSLPCLGIFAFCGWSWGKLNPKESRDE